MYVPIKKSWIRNYESMIFTTAAAKVFSVAWEPDILLKFPAELKY